MISNFSRVLNVVFFILGDSSASEFHVPTFRNTVFHLHSWCYITYEDKIKFRTPPLKMEQSVPKRRHIKFRRRASLKRKNTTLLFQFRHVHEDDVQKAGSFFWKGICYMFCFDVTCVG